MVVGGGGDNEGIKEIPCSGTSVQWSLVSCSQSCCCCCVWLVTNAILPSPNTHPFFFFFFFWPAAICAHGLMTLTHFAVVLFGTRYIRHFNPARSPSDEPANTAVVRTPLFDHGPFLLASSLAHGLGKWKRSSRARLGPPPPWFTISLPFPSLFRPTGGNSSHPCHSQGGSTRVMGPWYILREGRGMIEWALYYTSSSRPGKMKTWLKFLKKIIYKKDWSEGEW